MNISLPSNSKSKVITNNFLTLSQRLQLKTPTPQDITPRHYPRRLEFLTQLDIPKYRQKTSTQIFRSSLTTPSPCFTPDWLNPFFFFFFFSLLPVHTNLQFGPAHFRINALRLTALNYANSSLLLTRISFLIYTFLIYAHFFRSVTNKSWAHT